MDPAKKLKTSIYLHADLFWKFKEEIPRRRLSSDTSAMEEAIKLWLDAPPALHDTGHPPYSGPDRWHRILDRLIASDHEMKGIVLSMLVHVERELPEHAAAAPETKKAKGR